MAIGSASKQREGIGRGRHYDMKPDVVMVAIVLILGLHIYVTEPGHGFVHLGIYVYFICHII